VVDTSGRRSVTFVTILSLVFFLSGVTVGGVTGCYIGKAQAELAQCGLGTVRPRNNALSLARRVHHRQGIGLMGERHARGVHPHHIDLLAGL
jgi:hypothetical protein